MDITVLDPEVLREAGQVYEAVLPLPTCVQESGCRSIITNKDSGGDTIEFNLVDEFNIATSVSYNMLGTS